MTCPSVVVFTDTGGPGGQKRLAGIQKGEPSGLESRVANRTCASSPRHDPCLVLGKVLLCEDQQSREGGTHGEETVTRGFDHRDSRFPVGQFVFAEPAAGVRTQCIEQFRDAPGLPRTAVNGLTKEQLSSPYQPGGWTLAQVVHHLAESDARSVEIARSLSMFEAIRLRWADAWESLSEKDFQRQWRHARFGLVTVVFLLQQYA